MQGSIQKRTGKRGVAWTVVIELPRDPVTGKRRQQRLSAPSKREAESLLAEKLHELRTGTYVAPTTTTVGEYLPRWLEAIAPTVKPATLYRYEHLVRERLIPALGAVQVAKLAPLHVQEFYARQLQEGRKPATVALYHAVLHRALDQAVRWNLVVRNVCEAVEVPRGRAPEMQTWDAATARAFLAATADEPLAAFWRMTLTTALRLGELLALRWQDLDLDRGAARISRTLTRSRDGWSVGTPKTAAGRRQIALPPACVTALRAHRKAQVARRLEFGSAWHDDGQIFERGDGRALEPRTVQRTFHRLVSRAGLPPLYVHGLRHTAATLMLANGEHPRVVQERLGHSSIQMTMNRYSHVTMDMQQDAAARLEALLDADRPAREAAP